MYLFQNEMCLGSKDKQPLVAGFQRNLLTDFGPTLTDFQNTIIRLLSSQSFMTKK